MICLVFEGPSGALAWQSFRSAVASVRVGLALVTMVTDTVQIISGGDNRPPTWFVNVARGGEGLEMSASRAQTFKDVTAYGPRGGGYSGVKRIGMTVGNLRKLP